LRFDAIYKTGGIPFSEIKSYMEMFDIDDVDFFYNSIVILSKKKLELIENGNKD